MNKLFYVLGAALTLGLASCEKKDLAERSDCLPVTSDGFGKHTKELTIYDDAKDNSAVLLVGSDDKSILNMWTADNFRLIVVKEGENAEEVISNYIESRLQGKMKSEMAVTDDSDEMVAHITTRFLSEDLKSDVAAVALYTIDPYDSDMRGWKYATHYSYAQGGRLACIFTGHNFWHRGYCALDYQETAGGPWSVLIAPWLEVKNNQTIQREKSPCYQMRAQRRYKGSNPESVSVQFY